MSSVSDRFERLYDNVDAVILFNPSSSYFERFEDLDDVVLIVVAPTNDLGVEHFVALPLSFEELSDRVQFGIEGAIDGGHVDEGDTVVCAANVFDDEIDTVARVRVDSRANSGVYDLLMNSRPDETVIRDVIELAIELGKKGQKGAPVGALFIVGDAGKVMNKSRPLSYNPFEKSHVNVGDPIVKVMLKEFSRLDGAFVISDSGKIVSAYRYLEPSAEGVDIPKGLGARHMAAGAITRDTNAVAIVLSESDGLVRAFKSGELVLELDPEDY